MCCWMAIHEPLVYNWLSKEHVRQGDAHKLRSSELFLRDPRRRSKKRCAKCTPAVIQRQGWLRFREFQTSRPCWANVAQVNSGFSLWPEKNFWHEMWSGIWSTCFCHQGFMEKMKGRRLGLHKRKDFVTRLRQQVELIRNGSRQCWVLGLINIPGPFHCFWAQLPGNRPFSWWTTKCLNVDAGMQLSSL